MSDQWRVMTATIKQDFHVKVGEQDRETCLYSEHGLRTEYLKFFLSVGVIISLVPLEGRLLLGQRASLLIQTGIDYVGTFLSH